MGGDGGVVRCGHHWAQAPIGGVVVGGDGLDVVYLLVRSVSVMLVHMVSLVSWWGLYHSTCMLLF